MGQTDLILICSIVAIATAILAIITNRILAGWDLRFLNWFSEIAQSPRWFVLWILVLMSWIPIRALLVEHELWFRGDGDLLVMTILWSVIPFMVENAMKYSTARQMKVLEEQSRLIAAQTGQIKSLAGAIRTQLDDSNEKNDVIITLVTRLLDAIEQEQETVG